jgi:hypothetical protein
LKPAGRSLLSARAPSPTSALTRTHPPTNPTTPPPQSGDIFQLVLSQRFERRTFAQPFEIYRALRVVNPSPYMVYMQARGCVIVSSSPEILCRWAREGGRGGAAGGGAGPVRARGGVRGAGPAWTGVPRAGPDAHTAPRGPTPSPNPARNRVDGERVVTNRPLAGTRRRGADAEADAALERELLADEKECAEHVMLVDLGRNDVGKVRGSSPARAAFLSGRKLWTWSGWHRAWQRAAGSRPVAPRHPSSPARPGVRERQRRGGEADGGGALQPRHAHQQHRHRWATGRVSRAGRLSGQRD